MCRSPIWVWGGGFLGTLGVLDFAGGTVVHINAGVVGLVAAIVIGKRKGFPTTAMPPHNLGYKVIGASMCGSAGSVSTPAVSCLPTAWPAWPWP